MKDPVAGRSGLVQAGGLSTTQVGEQPAGPVGVEGGVQELTEKGWVVDGIESLREINREGCGAVGGLRLVKAGGNQGGQGQEGGGGGVHWAETVLGLVRGKGEVEMGKGQALEHLRCRAEERDRAIAAPLVRGLTSFGDWKNEGLLPEVGDLGERDGEIEDMGQVLHARGPQVL